jgi:hypothetical protein
MNLIDLAQDRSRWPAVVNAVRNLGFQRVQGYSWLGEELLAFQEELYFMELRVSYITSYLNFTREVLSRNRQIVKPNYLTHGQPVLRLFCWYNDVIYVYNWTIKFSFVVGKRIEHHLITKFLSPRTLFPSWELGIYKYFFTFKITHCLSVLKDNTDHYCIPFLRWK